MTRRERTQTFLLFVLLYVGGMMILPDYGISWDEPLQRNHGLVTTDYVNGLFKQQLYDGKLAEHEWKDYPYKDHGVFFQLVCLSIEKGFGLNSVQQQYRIRHRVGFTLFVTGALFLFLFLYRRCTSWNMAAFGLLLYLSFPRIFAHAFYNPKDIIALSWFCINLFTLSRFLEEKNTKWAVIHGLLNAMMMNSRIFAVFVAAVTMILLFLDQEKPLFRMQNKRLALISAVFVGSFIIFTILPWPNLWFDPFENLFQGLKRASRWHWEGTVLLNGNWVKATDLPWYYAPLWMLITLPLSHLLLIISGLILTCVASIKRFSYFGYRNALERIDFMVLLLFALPLAAIWYKKSVMYDGWRHLFFLYACMIYMALYAYRLWKDRVSLRMHPTLNKIVALVFIFYIGKVLVQMVYHHPFQQTYFNELIKKPSVERFEVDYWGLSYKQAYEALYEQFPEDTFVCVSRYDPAWYNYMALDDDIKKRIKFIDERSDSLPDHYYYVSIFRFDYELDAYRYRRHPSEKPKLILSAYGNPVVGVFEVGG